MSEAYGVGTLTLFSVSTRGVFMFMGFSDTFLDIILLIMTFVCLYYLIFNFRFKNKLNL